MKKFKIAVIGANGYTGFMLLKILKNHDYVEIVSAASRSNAGTLISDMYPPLKYAYGDMVFSQPDVDALEGVDLAFTALPHAASADFGAKLFQKGIKVVDLSADFRYDDLKLYESVYGVTHPCPHLNEKAVYGLVELNREKIATAQIVGNPGCYTSASILALKPLIDLNLIDKKGIVIDAKSGVTGAGRKADTAYSFCETDDNFKAYSVATHRHTSEIEEKLGGLTLSFTPHLLPVKRGILATIYADAKTSDYSRIIAAYDKYYANEKFVRFSGENLPELKWVRGSNICAIGAKLDKRTGKIIIISCIDNLIKGASGQAVQNMNVMLGLKEDSGLNTPAEYL